MASTPRRSIDPAYLQDMSCPICGQDTLQLKSMEHYPDYITCSRCESQFVLEDDGDRVMYGKIPASYPRTSRFALQQWVWPEAIARRATEERPAAQGTLSTTVSPVEPAAPPAPTGAETPVSSDAEQPEGSQAETDLQPGGPSSDDEGQADEADGLMAVPDDATIKPEIEAANEPDLDQLWAAESDELEMVAGGTETGMQAGPDAGASSTEPLMEDEEAAELDWDQALSGSAEDMGDQPPTFDYGLEDVEAGFEGEVSDVFSEEPVGQDEPEQPAAEPSDDNWFFAGSGQSEQTTEFEQDFAADVFGEEQEANPPEAGDEPVGEFGTSPPFAEDLTVDQTSDPLPGETEPAPPMPDWLQASTSGPEQAAGPSSPVEDTGEADDLLDTLWGGTGSAEGPGDDLDEAFAATGFGAPAGADDGEPDQPPSDAFDLWGEDETAPETPDSEMAEDLQASEAPPHDQGPGSPFESEGEPSWETESDSASGEGKPSQAEIAEMYWTGGVKSEEETAAEEPAPGEAPAKLEPEEPTPGIRYRVVIDTSDVQFPDELCAHCNGAPTVSKLPVNTAVYKGSGLGDRQMVTYRIPLCANCTERAYARSEEQQTARLQAHLISVLVAMLLVVVALATRLVDFQESIGLDLAILLVLAAMGYIIPAAFLLIRASHFPQPEDSKYVESTLRVPADTEGSETAFEWRNRTYARRFVAANQEQAVSGAIKVHEREYEGA